jgi:DNA-binding transcriptional LysR family regulator
VIETSLVEGEPRLVAEPLPSHPACFYCRSGHPLVAEADPPAQRILEFPYVGNRIPPRLARHFLAVAKTGSIDPDTGDYVPRVNVDTLWMAREVVLASDAVTGGPVTGFADDVRAGRLVRLRVTAPWARTGYGFVTRRDAVPSPAAEAFKDAMRAIEAELTAIEEAWLRGQAKDAGKAKRRKSAALG